MKTIVINFYKERCDTNVGRASKWGNPFSHNPNSQAKFIVSSRDEAIALHKFWILGQPDLLAELGELKGKILGCYCLPKACHATWLAHLADNFDESKDFSDYSAFW